MGEKIYLEENENKLENISNYKRSLKSLAFEDFSSRSQCSIKSCYMINFTKKIQKNTDSEATFLLKLQACNLKKALVQVFYCEFCQIF